MGKNMKSTERVDLTKSWDDLNMYDEKLNMISVFFYLPTGLIIALVLVKKRSRE